MQWTIGHIRTICSYSHKLSDNFLDSHLPDQDLDDQGDNDDLDDQPLS